MARERAESMDQAPLWTVDAAGPPGKLCRQTMASPQPGGMLAFTPSHWFIWGMSAEKEGWIDAAFR